MDARATERWRHQHVFLGEHHERNERRTRLVVAITAAMMAVEVVAGRAFGSLALEADGWHMATHAGALGVSALAYAWARKHAQSPRYVFGTGKIGDLAAFASALSLGAIAIWIAVESVRRMLAPQAVSYDQALIVAAVGLLVNVVCAFILVGGHEHTHEHEHAHPHGSEAQHSHDGDQNLRSAYLHVVADALTSVLAIAGLLSGKLLGLAWMDPAVGLVGSVLIARWCVQLVRQSGTVLLDMEHDPELSRRVRAAIEDGTHDHVSDLHVWRVGPGRFAAIIAVVTAEPREPDDYKRRLAPLGQVAHVTVEVHPLSAG